MFLKYFFFLIASFIALINIEGQVTSYDWLRSLKEDSEAYYDTQSLQVFPDGSVNEGNEAIKEYYKEVGFNVDSVSILYSIQASSKDRVVYEINKLHTDQEYDFYQMVIWKHQPYQSIRLVEFITKSETNVYDGSILDSTREKWIQLCNEHNVENLVNNMYTATPLYYNHRPLIKDAPSLIQVYSYMNNERYSLLLSPLKVVPVSKGIVYEIGQCSGSYGGKYMLVWKRDEHGQWKVLFDSNL